MMSISGGEENEMKKKKIKMESSCDDIISSSLESILHTIFSSIDMKQVVQTSILSRRWRNFWKSAPDLYFDHLLRKDMNFVDCVLLLRDNSSNIRKLRISFTDGEINSDTYRTLTWLNFASIRGVEEVYLEDCFSSSSDSPTELPPQLFATLKILELEFCGYIRLPKSLFSAPHLRILKCVSVHLHLPEGNSNGELVLTCPSLEYLVLYGCFIKNLKILNISAHQLKNLDIETYDSSYEIKISAPNLTSLDLWCDSYKNYSLENLSSLVSCCIGGVEGSDGSSCSFCIPSLMKILNAVTNVSTLEIYGDSCRKDTLPSEDVHDQLLNPFPNLTHLRVDLSAGFSIRTTVNLLRCSPSINTLIWDAREKYPCSESELEYWGKLLCFQYNFEGLKYVKARNLQVTDNELKFLEFLLKNAVALENITLGKRIQMDEELNLALENITLGKRIQMDEELNEFMKKLHSLPKASPRLEISFSP